jgi:hypothetical protein
VLTKALLASRAVKRRVATLSPTQLIQKRAHDRKSQRRARQRTKDYIEGLEKRIEDLTQAANAEYHSELAREEQRAIDLSKQVELLRSKIGVIFDAPVPISEENLVGIRDLTDPALNASECISSANYLPSSYVCPPEFGSIPSTMENSSKPYNTDIQALYQTPTYDSDSLIAQSTITHAPALAEDTWAIPTSSIDLSPPVNPARSEKLLENETATLETEATTNEWQLANQVFLSSDRVARGRILIGENEIHSHDIMIRALVDGWQAIDHLVGHIPMWQNLREIDEIVCKGFRDTERLAALQVMNARLTYLSNPSPKTMAMVPSWYLHR